MNSESLISFLLGLGIYLIIGFLFASLIYIYENINDNKYNIIYHEDEIPLFILFYPFFLIGYLFFRWFKFLKKISQKIKEKKYDSTKK
jgi:uncharacterized integral membrane protein